ncbi:hypothetical protein ACLOJK_030021 [Asimina triloba]
MGRVYSPNGYHQELVAAADSSVSRVSPIIIDVSSHCNRCFPLSRNLSSIFDRLDVLVNTPPTTHLRLQIPSTTIFITSGAHYKSKVPYQGVTITLNTHQTWGTPPYIHLDDPTPPLRHPCHIVNYTIHMDLKTMFEGLKCRTFPAALDKQDVKMEKEHAEQD